MFTGRPWTGSEECQLSARHLYLGVKSIVSWQTSRGIGYVCNYRLWRKIAWLEGSLNWNGTSIEAKGRGKVSISRPILLVLIPVWCRNLAIANMEVCAYLTVDIRRRMYSSKRLVQVDRRLNVDRGTSCMRGKKARASS